LVIVGQFVEKTTVTRFEGKIIHDFAGKFMETIGQFHVVGRAVYKKNGTPVKGVPLGLIQSLRILIDKVQSKVPADE
jgi:hypothetical protein